MSLPAPLTPGAAEAQVGQLFAVALALRSEGRHAQALPILEQLAVLHPGRLEIRLAHATALADLGRTLEAIAQLNVIKSLGTPRDVLAAVQALAETAVGKFNLNLARGEVADAERYAAALAELLPQNTASRSPWRPPRRRRPCCSCATCTTPPA